MIKQGVIIQEERELYQYAAKTLIFTISPVIIAAFVGIITGRVVESIVIVIPFMLVRIYAGGFHMKSLMGCLLLSSILLLICTEIGKSDFDDWFFYIVTIVSCISLSVFSPIETPQKKLILQKRKRYKRTVVLITLSLGLIIAIMFLFNLGYYAKHISIGLLLSAFLQGLHFIVDSVKHLFDITTD